MNSIQNTSRSEELLFTAAQAAAIFGLHVKTVRKWRLNGLLESKQCFSRLKISYDELLSLVNRGKRIDREGTRRQGLDPDRVLADAEAISNARLPDNLRGPFLYLESMPPQFAVEIGLRRLAGQSLEVIRDDMGLTGHAILELDDAFKRRLSDHLKQIGNLDAAVKALSESLSSPNTN